MGVVRPKNKGRQVAKRCYTFCIALKIGGILEFDGA
jgi:hypothetical protein